MNKLLTRMLEQADPGQAAGLARFFKTGPGQYGEGDKFLGIKVPVTRAVVKECWRETGFPALEACIASEYHEVRLAALLALVEIFRHAGKRPAAGQTAANQTASPAAGPTAANQTASPAAGSTAANLTASRRQCIDFYLAHTDRINNWDLVDLSCYPLLGEWLLDKDRTLLYELARNGKTLWEQRIGIVSTMTFLRHGQLADTFAIADILLHHPHDLIHKAVGWLLREAGKRDKAALEAWLRGPATADDASSFAGLTGGSPRCQTMPRTMLRYAIERFPEPERQQYLRRP